MQMRSYCRNAFVWPQHFIYLISDIFSCNTQNSSLLYMNSVSSSVFTSPSDQTTAHAQTFSLLYEQPFVPF